MTGMDIATCKELRKVLSGKSMCATVDSRRSRRVDVKTKKSIKKETEMGELASSSPPDFTL